MLVNVINGVFSFWQEHRASQATEALKKMLPAYTTVIRDGADRRSWQRTSSRRRPWCSPRATRSRRTPA